MICKSVAIAASLFLLTSCAPAPAPDTRADEEAAIRKLDEEWSATAAKLDLDGTVTFYSDDAVLLPPNAPIATTKQAIREGWAGLLAPGTVISWTVTKTEVAKSAELGYLYGAYKLAMKDPSGGPDIHDTGKLLEVWKKQADGKWKCIVDTFNSDLPMPAPPAPKK